MEGNFDQQWMQPQTFGAGKALSPELLKWMAQQQPSASGWDGGGQTFGGYTVAPVNGIQTGSDGSISNPGIQGYVSENNTQSQLDNIYDPNAVANLYGADGGYQSSFTPEDPYKMDWQEKLILAGLAAGGGATMMGFGGGFGTMGANGAFLGEGALSGIGAWDAALASAPSWSAGGAAGAMGEFLGEAPWTPTPNSTPLDFSSLPATQKSSFLESLKSLAPESLKALDASIPGGLKSLLGPAAALLGAAAGAEGTPGSSETSTRKMDPRMDALVYGESGIAPRVQGLLDPQMADAKKYGDEMTAKGSSLLDINVAGNGTGQVKLENPTTPTNPYLSGMADDIQRRTMEMLQKNNLGIQSSYVGGGGMGNTRMGVAQGTAAGDSADYLSGNLSKLYGSSYDGDMNRSLSKYQGDQSFYTGQRGQDLMQVGAGADLLKSGLQMPMQPLEQASRIYAPFTGFGNTTNSTPEKDSGWQGVAGGLLTGAAFGKSMNWWG